MKTVFKNIFAPILLLSFVTVAFLSFASMSPGHDGRMQSDCPFATTNTSFCPQDAFGMVTHHLSGYQSFLTTTIDFGMTALLTALSLIGFALVFSTYAFFRVPVVPLRVQYASPPTTSSARKLTHWLSILENSPSFP